MEEDADDDFSSRVLYNENHVVHKLQRRRHERALLLRPTMPNAILYSLQTIT